MTRRIVTQCESIDADFFMISVIRNAVRSSAFWLRLRAAGSGFQRSYFEGKTQPRQVIDKSGDCA